MFAAKLRTWYNAFQTGMASVRASSPFRQSDAHVRQMFRGIGQGDEILGGFRLERWQAKCKLTGVTAHSAGATLKIEIRNTAKPS